MFKKGQFYIIAAVAIAVILASLVTVINYAVTKPEPAKFYDLSKQLNYETTKIINYGVINNEKDINATIKKFIDEQFLPYVKQKDPDVELIYIYGNSSSATIVNYGKQAIKVGEYVITPGGSTTPSKVSIDIGGTRAEKTVIQASRYFEPFTLLLKPERIVEIDISGTKYNFTLAGQQQFFAIMTAKKEGETYITTSP